MMATRIDYNDIFDPQGNLISSTAVEVEIVDPVDPAIAAFAATLTEEQRAALLAALQQ